MHRAKPQHYYTCWSRHSIVIVRCIIISEGQGGLPAQLRYLHNVKSLLVLRLFEVWKRTLWNWKYFIFFNSAEIFLVCLPFSYRVLLLCTPYNEVYCRLLITVSAKKGQQQRVVYGIENFWAFYITADVAHLQEPDASSEAMCQAER